jgi:hypothetical protein
MKTNRLKNKILKMGELYNLQATDLSFQLPSCAYYLIKQLFEVCVILCKRNDIRGLN